MKAANNSSNDNNNSPTFSNPAHGLGPRQIRIPSQRPVAQTETTNDETSNAPLRLRSSNETISVLQDFVIPAPAATVTPAKSAPRKAKSKGSIILPAIVVTGLIAFAYLAVNTSVTSFQSSWNRSDYSRSASPDKASNRFVFQNDPIPGPFAGVTPAWESVKSKIPFLTSSNEVPVAE
jgi:hypothetical protein